MINKINNDCTLFRFQGSGIVDTDSLAWPTGTLDGAAIVNKIYFRCAFPALGGHILCCGLLRATCLQRETCTPLANFIIIPLLFFLRRFSGNVIGHSVL